MPELDVVYEITCDDCDSIFEVHTTEENEHEPVYCTFCGNPIPDEEIYDDEDEETFDDTYNELKEIFKDEDK